MNKCLAIIMFVLLWSCSSPNKSSTNTEITTLNSTSLFSLLNPDSTGLDYFNELNETETLNILTYEYLYNGGGIAVGDINNDGLPDVFMVGNTYGGRLFLNKGNLKFEQISEQAGVFIPGFTTGVSMVDINADGWLDIYLCRSLANEPEQRRNVLLINNGDLTFTNQAKEYRLDDPSFSNHANFFDYDKDGDLDMYLLNHRTDFKDALTIKTYTDEKGVIKRAEDTTSLYVSDRLYRNDGHQFTDVTQEAGLLNRAFGLSSSIADINADGWPDIYVANDYADKDHLYINQQNGSFKDEIEQYFFHTSKNAMGSDIADFNNDGLLDLMSLDMMAEDNYRQKQLKGTGSYDLYQMAVKYGLTHQVMRNTLQLNNGDGSFSEIGQLAGISHTDWSWTPLFADLDNDGWKDLFISNGYYRDVTDMDYLKYESNEVLLNEGGVPNASPLALTQRMKHNPVANYVFRNKGDLSFSNQTKAWGMDTAAISNGAIYADLDLDGDLDLVTNNLNSKAFVFRNNANELTENNYLQIQLKGSKGNVSGVGTKLTIETAVGKQFQEASPYRGFLSSVEPLIHFGLGSQKEVQELRIIWPDGYRQELFNIQGNQRIILDRKDALPPSSTHPVLAPPLLQKVAKTSVVYTHREDNFIDFKREPLLEHQLSNKGPFLAKGDVNGDGLDDVYFTASAGFTGELFLQTKSGSFQKKDVAVFTHDAAHEDGQALFFDADGDADLDLYVVSGGSAFPQGDARYQDRLYINNGKGDFEQAESTIPQLSFNGTSVTAFDADGDDDLDLFIGGGVYPGAYPLCEESQLLMNTNGKFELANHLLPHNGKLGMINDVKSLDVNEDGKFDLILVGEWMPITFLMNSSNGFQENMLPHSSGWWNTIELGDFNMDGKMDFVAGNRGENNFYKASKEKPATIYAKDFDDNGSVDALPFYYFNDGKAHPKHTLDEVFAQYPAIRRKFPRYKKYSSATLTDLFSDEQLKGSVQLSAQSFSSCYFENEGNGNFSIHVLPKSAQFSEVHGMLPIDLNRDGKLDLLITGNNYSADVEAGRHDASIGCALLGDGKGNFKPLTATESGFSIVGDHRGVYLMERDGQEEYWVLVNSGVLQRFALR